MGVAMPPIHDGSGGSLGVGVRVTGWAPFAYGEVVMITPSGPRVSCQPPSCTRV
jgi:hypothetical protein